MTAPANLQLSFHAGAPAFLKTPAHYLKIVRVGEPEPAYKIDSPELAQSYWTEVIARQPIFDESKEHLAVLLLSTRYNITGFNIVSVGSLNESIAHPRDVFRLAVAGAAYAIIVMHNHPSGDPSPSQADHSLTRRLAECGELLQIKVLDHVITGKPAEGRLGYFSFKEAGIL